MENQSQSDREVIVMTGEHIEPNMTNPTEFSSVPADQDPDGRQATEIARDEQRSQFFIEHYLELDSAPPEDAEVGISTTREEEAA
jgi:hypothetical protein